ncbi:S9 family peptidase [Segetibacter sp.]|uniref:S9 family peptidase n=1 Tax=Segetibacter sp. TaxID=2231182 RepID=UPI0026272AB8|nr:S9 family peptidase [Segetibacter sp.]MCW3079874.1 peptidase prolyl oligopeptidase [Segetibacter sp.]
MKKLIIYLLLSHQVIFAQDTTSPAANLIASGIPAIPDTITEGARRYSEFRSAVFCDWHPRRQEMIISTRFGNVPQLHLVSMPLGARKQLTFFNEPINNATYEPVKGEYFLFTKDKGGDEFSQIYRYNLSDGTITLVTDGKRSQNGGIVWSRKGKLMAYSSTARNGADRDIYIMDPLNPSTNRLLIEVSGGGWGVLDWSPDDKQLLVSEKISANESHYWLVDIGTGTKKELTPQGEQGVYYGHAKFNKNGTGIYFITDKDNEFSRLAYMDFLTKNIVFYTSAIKWNVEAFDVSEDGKRIAFVTNEAGETKLYLLNTTTPAQQYFLVRTIPAGVYANISFHRDGKHLLVSVNTAQSPADLYVISTSNGKTERWTESEMGGIVPTDLRPHELIKWRSFDGKEISGFYYKPAIKFAGKRPVIINIHGGPEGQSLPVFQGENNYYLNELGTAIIYPNVRGSSGYGKTFLKADNGMKREESVKDIGALLDWIAQQPNLDTSRIMVTGGSYGGYVTLAVAANYNDRIRCAVDIVGISNFNTFLKNTESYRRDLRRVEYGDERDTAMAAYFEKISPVNNAQKIAKPLFIVQGGNDPRVPRTESVQMADKLRANGTIVWYLEAKDEGHGFRKKNNVDFKRNATILFMKNFLLNEL